jgi:hypothetical protein
MWRWLERVVTVFAVGCVGLYRGWFLIVFERLGLPVFVVGS